MKAPKGMRQEPCSLAKTLVPRGMGSKIFENHTKARSTRHVQHQIFWLKAPVVYDTLLGSNISHILLPKHFQSMMFRTSLSVGYVIVPWSVPGIMFENLIST